MVILFICEREVDTKSIPVTNADNFFSGIMAEKIVPVVKADEEEAEEEELVDPQEALRVSNLNSIIFSAFHNPL